MGSQKSVGTWGDGYSDGHLPKWHRLDHDSDVASLLVTPFIHNYVKINQSGPFLDALASSPVTLCS